jgi:hypothetical protein
VDPVPDQTLLRKFGSAGNRTRTSGSVYIYIYIFYISLLPKKGDGFVIILAAQLLQKDSTP